MNKALKKYKIIDGGNFENKKCRRDFRQEAPFIAQ
jgi:hypothetical protein